MIKIGDKNIKIWTVSDTHSQHGFLEVPDVDMMIHSGDATNWQNQYKNKPEFEDFVHWIWKMCSHIPVRLFTPGNHDTFFFHNQKVAKAMLKEVGVDALVDEVIEVMGLKVFMSPYTPEYGSGWVYQLHRGKSYNRFRKAIPDDVDIVSIHGMPQGILDVSENLVGDLAIVGDKGLMTRLEELPNLKLFTGGHLHSSGRINNHGVLIRNGVYYANSSVVKDGEINKGTYNNGFIFEM